MSAQPIPMRKVAQRPAPRTASVALTGDYLGWEAEVRVDFPAKLVGELQSGAISRIVPALDSIVISHNFPDDQGQLAASMGDVDTAALAAFAAAIGEAIGRLPPR